MNVERTIVQLCRSYGVSRAFGERLRPLLESAAQSPDEKRKRLVGLVERSFAEEARRLAIKKKGVAKRLTRSELAVLKTVANVLDGWEPPKHFQRFRADDESDGE